METQTFGKAIKTLCRYYEKTIPARETIEFWLEKLAHLPDECMPWMISQITDSQDRWPANLPSVMLKLWPQWLRAHPDKVSYYENGCTDCDDVGWLHVRDKNGRVCAFACKCGKLQNSAPKAWLHDLLRNGYTEDTLDEAARWRVPSQARSNSSINWLEYLDGME